MNKLNQVIDNYLKSEEPYALQIDGEWGVGKTFFIRNQIIEELKEHNYPVYFSVYGHNDLNDLKQELFYQIISVLNSGKNIETQINSVNKKFKKISGILGESKLKSIGLVSDWILESYNSSKLNSSIEGKPIIIFIDDLERLSQNIALKDLLGFILNELLEKLKCKVIILSNDSEISGVDDFRRIKEKVISRTVKFKYDISTIENMVLKKSKNTFIKDNSTWITIILENQQILSEQKGLNMRTLFSIIENFNFIESKLTDEISNLESDQLKIKIRKTIFLNVFVITSEYKLGNINDSNFKLLRGLTNTRSFIYYLDKNETKTIKEKIFDRYHNKSNEFDDYIFYSNDINSYLFLGYMDHVNYVEDWKNIFLPKTKELNNLEKLNSFRRYTDNELEQVQKDILNDVKNEKFNFNELIRVYGQLKQFEKLDLVFLDSHYSEIIETKLIKEYLIIDNYESINLVDKFYMSGSFNIKQENPILFKKFKQIENQRNKIQNSYFIDCLFAEKNEEIIDMKQNQFLLNNNIFKGLLVDEIIDNYIVVDNNKADILWKFINSEYLSVINSKDFHAGELEDIKLFLKEINDRSEQKKLGRIDCFKIKQLIESLEKLIDHLK